MTGRVRIPAASSLLVIGFEQPEIAPIKPALGPPVLRAKMRESEAEGRFVAATEARHHTNAIEL
jgi:hypothetical protein